MTFPQYYAYLRGRERERLHGYRQARIVAWAVLRSQSRKNFKPEDVFSLPNDGERIATRSGISPQEHKKLIEKYRKVKQKQKS